MYVMDTHTIWEDFLNLVEFSYKIYQTSIKVSPYKALYGRKCHTPLRWSQTKDKLIMGPDSL